MPVGDPSSWSVRELRSYLAAAGRHAEAATCVEKSELVALANRR